MDLWIRSQNRTRLIPKPNLYVVESEAGITYIGDTMVGHIGEYATKERALEVLDEIQKLLMPTIISTPIIEKDIKPEYTYIYYASKGSDIEVMQLNSYVYEMPLD